MSRERRIHINLQVAISLLLFYSITFKSFLNDLSVIRNLLDFGCDCQLMQQVIIIILFFGLCIHGQMERHTLQGALSLLEKGQNDISQYDQQDLILYIWCGQIRNVVVKLFHPITENKLANDYPIFRSIPAVILMAGFIPVMVLVVFSYGMFKFITYEHKKMEFKYTKLPVKEIPKPQNNQLSYPPSSVFVFGFI